jgi:hypothetical protein
MGSTSNDAYKDKNSSVFNVTLQAYLNSSITSPNGEAYQRGQNVTINFTVVDDCNHGVSGLSPKIHLYSDDAYYLIQSGITDYGDGNYSYNWSTTNPDKDLSAQYNITVETPEDNYFNYNSTRVSAFSLGTGPQLQNPVKQTGDGWGETWTFRIQCRDVEEDVFNVSLWKRKNETSNWELLETKPCSGTSWNTTYFTSNYFDCGDIELNGHAQYKFNATDQWNFTATTDTANFTINKDNITITVKSGDDLFGINREGSGYKLL